MFWWYRAHDNRNFARARKNGRAREQRSPGHTYPACAYRLTRAALIGSIHSAEVMPVYSGTQAFWYNRLTPIVPLGFESRSLFLAKLQKSKLAQQTCSHLGDGEKCKQRSRGVCSSYNFHLCTALIYTHFICLYKFWLRSQLWYRTLK